MQEYFKQHLFNKFILVNDNNKGLENNVQALFSLANVLNIKIVKGANLASLEVFKFAADMIDVNVPAPFYKGFPESVRNLTPEQLLFDQLVHYAVTYGFGDFSQPGHSLFYENFEKIAFKEKAPIKEFVILNQEDAEKELEQMVKNLLQSTRPLSEQQYSLVKSYYIDYKYNITECNCKDTVIRLLLDTNNFQLVKLIRLNEVINLVEYLNYQSYGNTKIKKLNLKNKHRKFLSKVLDVAIENQHDITDCFEKQAIWCGILHQIHYKPKTEKAEHFVNQMRNAKNNSVYSHFKNALEQKNIKQAVDILVKNKGVSALIRNLNYVISRCENLEDVEYIIKNIKSSNNIILIQNLIQYANYKSGQARTFKFTKYNKLKTHTEDEKEQAKRQSIITKGMCNKICEMLKQNLQENLKNQLGKVYIDSDMQNITLPLQENTAMGGFNTLPKGSRINILADKKIRAFVYWEKVNDIDLSAIGLTDDLKQTEFSWRTMASKQSTAITFSGDITSGYNGASEYFDIDLEKIAKEYPKIKYLVINANVYSMSPFNQCICKAGYMQRDIVHSGEIYEPKTVETAFAINCESTFAHLFAIDVLNKQIIWLNIAKEGNVIIAGATDLSVIADYFNLSSVINMKSYFEMMATQVVTDPMQADVVVSDKQLETKEDAQIIRSTDTDKILALLNN